MNILIIASTDADNWHIINICKELERRGHTLTVYNTQNHEAVFRQLKAKIEPIKNLDDKALKSFHFALCADVGARALLTHNIYVFVYEISFFRFMPNASDFVLRFWDGKDKCFSLRAAQIPIGNPKNDNMDLSDDGEQKQILYIDSGHFPFGYDGKVQIADMLLQVCEENPDYEIVIKPRWLRSQTTFLTHRNMDHIYDVIEERCNGDIPPNLNMLEEHFDLHELIRSSHSVISLNSGAVFDVLSYNKGLCIVGDYAQTDKFDMRLGLNKAEIDFFARSGCVVSITDIPKLMPHGIKGDKGFLSEVLPNVTGASAKAADVMEFVYENFLKHHKYPAIKNYSYDNYVDEMIDSKMSFNEIKQIRFENNARRDIEICKTQLSLKLDFSEVYDFILKRYAAYPFTTVGMNEFAREYHLLKNKILRDNRDLLMRDPIDQDILLKALFEMGYYDEIINMRSEEILAVGPHHYYTGRILRQRAEAEAALVHFVVFIREANSRNFEIFLTEVTNVGYKTAYTELYKVYDGKNMPPRKIAETINGLHESKRANILPRDLHDKMHQKLYSAEAEALVEDESKPIYQAGKWIMLHEQFGKVQETKKLKDEINRLNRDIKRFQEGVEVKRLNEEIKHLKGGGEIKRLNVRIKNLDDEIAKLEHNRLGILHRLRKGFRYLREHGLLNTIKEKLFKRLAHPFNVPMQLRHNFREGVLKGFNVYRGVMREFGENAELYLPSPSIGDPYIFGAKFNSFCKRQRKGIVSVWLACRGGGERIAQLFGIKNVMQVDDEEYKNLYRLIMFNGKILHCFSLHPHVMLRHTCIISRLWGFKEADFVSLHTVFAYGDIPDSEAQKPVFNNDRVDEIIRNYGLIPNKTIVLSPYAKSIEFIPTGFWNMLVEKLSARGYDVLTNCSFKAIYLFGSEELIKEEPIEGTRGICVPYDNFVPFLEQTIGLIALRSGIQDASESANCLNISLQHKQGKFKAFYGSLNDIYSMRNNYARDNDRPHMYDLLYTPEHEYALIDQIVSMVVEYADNRRN